MTESNDDRDDEALELASGGRGCADADGLRRVVARRPRVQQDLVRPPRGASG